MPPSVIVGYWIGGFGAPIHPLPRLGTPSDEGTCIALGWVIGFPSITFAAAAIEMLDAVQAAVPIASVDVDVLVL